MTPEPSLSLWLDRHRTDVDALLLDIDGVMLNGKRRLAGSRDFLEQLNRLDLPYLFLTNDGNHSACEKAVRMNQAGLTVDAKQIVSCGHAVQPLVRSMGMAGHRVFVMGDLGAPCYAEAAGLDVTRSLDRLGTCQGVIIGEENYPWEPVINAVVNHFIDFPDAPLIVPNPDEFYPGPELKIHIAAGGIGRFIKKVLASYGVKIDPIYLGKPHPPIFALARTELETRANGNVDPGKILMVGDNLAADITGGLGAGYRTALMLTGVTRLTALGNQDVLPDMVFEAL